MLVPILINALGLDGIIYYRGSLKYEMIFNLCFTIFLSFLLVLFFTKSQKPFNLENTARDKNLVIYLSFFILFWIFAFILGGGADYRENDVSNGVINRSLILRTIFIFNGVVSILCIYILHTKQRNLVINNICNLIVIIFLLVNVYSGSRGFVVQIFMSYFIVRLLCVLDEKKVWKGIFIINIRKIFQNIRLLTKSIVLGFCFLGIIAFWGAQRDGFNDVTFSILHRLSEPYWHFAYLEWSQKNKCCRFKSK